MPPLQIQGKSLSAIAKDIVEGYAYLNPLIMKKFEEDTFKALYQILRKTQRETRAEKFPLNDIQKLRARNQRLQRLHQAITVLEHAAKEKKIPL